MVADDIVGVIVAVAGAGFSSDSSLRSSVLLAME